MHQKSTLVIMKNKSLGVGKKQCRNIMGILAIPLLRQTEGKMCTCSKRSLQVTSSIRFVVKRTSQAMISFFTKNTWIAQCLDLIPLSLKVNLTRTYI